MKRGEKQRGIPETPESLFQLPHDGNPLQGSGQFASPGQPPEKKPGKMGRGPKND
jgi:hypothetical protein